MTLLRLSHYGTQDILEKYGVCDSLPSLTSTTGAVGGANHADTATVSDLNTILGTKSSKKRLLIGRASAKSSRKSLETLARYQDGPSPWEQARRPTRIHISSSSASGSRQGTAIDFMKIAASWDRGSRSVRERILQDFIDSCRHKTCPQLEMELGLGASLFLTRISAWLRLTYLLNYNLSLQMEAIGIFLSASGGSQFLNEFLEIGGALTLLEMISLVQVKESDKASALKLLIHISNAGRRHKEFLCECQAVRAVSDCLARSRFDLTQDYARHLLQELGTGNPKYLMSVYKTLLALLTSPSSLVAQQMAGQALRSLLPMIPMIHPSIVEATLALLKSTQLPLQHEGYELLKELVPRENLQDTIIAALVDVLTMVVDTDDGDDGVGSGAGGGNGSGGAGGTMTSKGGIGKKVGKLKMLAVKGSKSEGTGVAGPVSAVTENLTYLYIQQAYAARLLGTMAALSPELCQRMVHSGVLAGLVMTIANIRHIDSQRHASNLLHYLTETFDTVRDAIRDHLGSTFYEFFASKPDTYYRELNREQVRYLRRNAARLKGRGGNAAAAAARVTAPRGRDEEMPIGPGQQQPDGPGKDKELGDSGVGKGLPLLEPGLGLTDAPIDPTQASPADAPRTPTDPPVPTPTKTPSSRDATAITSDGELGTARSGAGLVSSTSPRIGVGSKSELGSTKPTPPTNANTTRTQRATMALQGIASSSSGNAHSNLVSTPPDPRDSHPADSLYTPLDPMPVPSGSLTARKGGPRADELVALADAQAAQLAAARTAAAAAAGSIGKQSPPGAAAGAGVPTTPVTPGPTSTGAPAAQAAPVAMARVEAPLVLDETVRKIVARGIDAEMRSRFPDRPGTATNAISVAADDKGSKSGTPGVNSRMDDAMATGVALFQGLSEVDEEVEQEDLEGQELGGGDGVEGAESGTAAGGWTSVPPKINVLLEEEGEAEDGVEQ